MALCYLCIIRKNLKHLNKTETVCLLQTKTVCQGDYSPFCCVHVAVLQVLFAERLARCRWVSEGATVGRNLHKITIC